MKYLIISKKPGSILTGLSTERLDELVKDVEEGMTNGTVDGVYGMVEGGLVAIVVAEDQAALARGLRKIGIHDAEVYPIRDAIDLIRKHVESRHSAARA